MAGGIVGTPSVRLDICGAALVVLVALTLVRSLALPRAVALGMGMCCRTEPLPARHLTRRGNGIQVFEILTQWVHAKFADDKASMQMVHKIEMQLMILGFLSFSLVMSNEYNLPWIPNVAWFHAFEFAHILLFYAACFLILRALVMRRLLKQLVKTVDRLQREDIQVTLDKFIASTEEKKGLDSCIRGVLGSTDSNRWDLAWQIMRKVVPRKPGFRDDHHTQEVDEEFDFALYCDLILQRDIVHSVHISGPIWAVIGLIGFVVTLSSLDFADPVGSLETFGEQNAAREDACNTALPVSDRSTSVAAAAVFTGGLVSGVVTFTQEAAGAVMAIDLHWDDREQAVGGVGSLPWHIHEKPVDATGCGSTAGHYIPECATELDTCTESGVQCPSTDLADRAGELSARVGDLCNGLSTCLTADDSQLFSTVVQCAGQEQNCLNSNGGVQGSPTQRQIVRLPVDSVIQLSGTNTIIGRSIVIHDASADRGRLACATIDPAPADCVPPQPTGLQGAVARAVFEPAANPNMISDNDDLLSLILIFQEAASQRGSHTIIELQTVPENVANNGLPNNVGGWHVHVDLRGNGDDACAATGGHYDPQCFGIDSHAGIGELTHRHGPLRRDMLHGTTWIDSHLPLSGPDSIIGRSIVIHNADGDRIACANIEVLLAQGRRHLVGNITSTQSTGSRPRPRVVAEVSSAYDARGIDRMPRLEMTSTPDSRRKLGADLEEVKVMPVEDAWRQVLIVISFCWITTALLYVLLCVQRADLAKLLKYRGWHSDDAEVLRTCVSKVVSAKQLPDTAVEVAHGATAEHGHGHRHSLCALSGYNTKEKAFNFIVDALICLNCFYSAFCVLYGLYATHWTDIGWPLASLLNVFLFVPAAYQFVILGPNIARDRAMLSAYIHLDEELLREVEVYTARKLDIKAALCEKVLLKLDEANRLDVLGASGLTEDERALKAAEFFFELDRNADGQLSPDELESAIVALRLRVTHNEIKQLVREIDTDQSGLIGREELEEFLKINLTTVAITSNKAAAGVQLGFDKPQQSRQDASAGRQRSVVQTSDARPGVSRITPPALGTLGQPQMITPPALSTLGQPQMMQEQGARGQTRTATTPMRGAKRKPPPLPAKSVVFSQYDKDASGTLDASEVRALLRARGISPAALDEYFGQYDTDGDGVLSEQEFDGLYAQLASQAQQGAPRATRGGARRRAENAGSGTTSRI